MMKIAACITINMIQEINQNQITLLKTVIMIKMTVMMKIIKMITIQNESKIISYLMKNKCKSRDIQIN